MVKIKTTLLYLLTLFLLGAISTASIAQELCEALARQAFEEVDDNCAGVDSQNACYGFNTLNATFNADIAAEASFESPSDLVELLQIHTVRTSAYDEQEEEWGIGYFQIPVEDQDPIVVMMAGDVIVENAIEVDADGEVNPLQNFNFTTAGPSDCRQAPNAVFIQSPRSVPVDLIINSTPIRLGSTVVIGTEFDDQGEEIMWFSVLEGKLEVFPDSPQSQVINEGFYSTVVLSDENGDGLDGEDALDSDLVPVLDKVTGEPIIGPDGEPFYRRVPVTIFEEPAPLTEDGESFRSFDAYTFVSEIPETLVNYEVTVTEEGIQTETQTVQSTAAPVIVSESTAAPTNTPVLVTGGTCADGNVNWCYAGQPWDDGRCNDPDANVSAWYWQAGYYNALLECGSITALPPEYSNATPIPTATLIPTNTLTPTPTITPTDTPAPFTAAMTGCVVFSGNPAYYEANFSYSNIPAGTTAIEYFSAATGGLVAPYNSINTTILVSITYKPITKAIALPSGTEAPLTDICP